MAVKVSLQLLITLIFALSASPQSVRTGSIAGSYVAERMDGRPLPAELRVSSTRGYSRWLKLDQAVLRLQNNGRFTISARYDEQLVRLGRNPNGGQVKSETRQGRYTVVGDRITLTPFATASEKFPRPYSGKLQGAQMTVAIEIKEYSGPRSIVVLFRRDAAFW